MTRLAQQPSDLNWQPVYNVNKADFITADDSGGFDVAVAAVDYTAVDMID